MKISNLICLLIGHRRVKGLRVCARCFVYLSPEVIEKKDKELYNGVSFIEPTNYVQAFNDSESIDDFIKKI